VRIGTDHETTGEGIVLKNDLVDDTRAGTPETNTELTARLEEVVNLSVTVVCDSKIGGTVVLSLNEVITVNSGGDSNSRETRRDELKESHLSSSILHSNTIRLKVKIRLTTNDRLSVLGVAKVRENVLLGKGEGAATSRLLSDSKLGRKLLVRERSVKFEVAHGHVGGHGALSDRTHKRHAANAEHLC
jgi:hypothetical protein